MRSVKVIFTTCLIAVVALLFGDTFGNVIAQGSLSAPDMLERALPGVVTVALTTSDSLGAPFGLGPGGDPMDVAFEKVLDLSETKGSGSGFVIDQAGRKYVVTNAHVIQNAQQGKGIVVYSINQTRYDMDIVGADSMFDIAVLRFRTQPGQEMGSLRFRSAAARLGETVYAVGTPLGKYPYTVTQGIIGGKNRVLDGITGKYGYVQSSATTIWGNSGGPLVDTSGQVLGINSSIEIVPATEENKQVFVQPHINFALEGPVASRLVTEILTNNGRVRRAFLGMEIAEVIDDKGVMRAPPKITDVLANGPGKNLTSYVGSTIKKIGQTTVRNVEEVLGALEQVRPGDTVLLELDKGGKVEQVSVKSSELSTQNLEEIARLLFSKASLEVRAEAGRLSLRSQQTPGPSPRASFQLHDISMQNRAIRPAGGRGSPGNSPAVGYIIGAGTPAGSWWRVRTLADLGLVIKMSALSGVLDFIDPDMKIRRIGLFPNAGNNNANTNLLQQVVYY